MTQQTDLSAAPTNDTTLQADLLLKSIAHRRSMGLARLSSNEVDHSLIEKMLEAANWAPSHGDTEPWRFTVFSGEGRNKLADLFSAAALADAQGTNQKQLEEAARKRAYAAPVWISIGVAPAVRDDGTLVMSIDEEIMAVACAVQNLHLMASTLGLAGMWHSKGTSVAPAVAEGLGLNAPSRLLGFFMCGWPSTEWLEGTRGSLSDKVTWYE